MLRRTLVLAALAPFLVFCGGEAADTTKAADSTGKPGGQCGLPALTEEKLSVATQGNDATVTGDADLLARIASFESKRSNMCETHFAWGTQGFALDWGDDPMRTRIDADDQAKLASGCADTVKHHYSVPGTFRVTGTLGGPGPTDGWVTTWEANNDVVVAGTPAAPELELVDTLAGTTVHVEDAIPFTWSWNPGKPLALELALVDDTGAALTTESICPTGYVGKGAYTIKLAGEKAYALVENGPINVHTRIRLLDGADMVLEKTSGAFTYAP